jgi:hypothetical protein
MNGIERTWVMGYGIQCDGIWRRDLAFRHEVVRSPLVGGRDVFYYSLKDLHQG